MDAPKSIYITDFPLPPSSNNIYRDVVFNRKAIRVPTAELKAYKRDANLWAEKQGREKILEYGRHIHSAIKQGFVVSVDCYFIFDRTRIWTLPTNKKNPNAAKKMDTTNRLKVPHDCFAEIVKCDDSYFFMGWYEKVERAPEDYERTVMVFNFRKPRSSNELVFPGD